MALPIETLEAFFEEKFRFEQGLGQLTRFDGYAYWHVLLMPDDGEYLRITAGADAMLDTFPTVEVGGHYSDNVTVSPLSGGVGFALVLHPKGCDDNRDCVVITKLTNGRLSLSFLAGKRPAA